MRYVNSKEIRSNPSVLWKEDESVITVNGKPVAIVKRITGDPQEELIALKQVRAMRAVEKLRLFSKQKGLNKISDEEVEEIIEEVRNENSR